MTTRVTAHRLYVLVGLALIGLGLFALIHPEFARGGSLVLLGLAALARGSGRVRRLLGISSSKFDDDPPMRRRPGKSVRPTPARSGLGWQPVTRVDAPLPRG